MKNKKAFGNNGNVWHCLEEGSNSSWGLKGWGVVGGGRILYEGVRVVAGGGGVVNSCAAMKGNVWFSGYRNQMFLF